MNAGRFHALSRSIPPHHASAAGGGGGGGATGGASAKKEGGHLRRSCAALAIQAAQIHRAASPSGYLHIDLEET